jgi:hypothetical protein
MSTFMGAAWADLAPGTSADEALAWLRGGDPGEDPFTLYADVVETPAGPRVELQAEGNGYADLARWYAGLIAAGRGVTRALVALDHDEYGAELIVLTTGEDGRPGRVYHVYAHPQDEDTGEIYEEGEPTLEDVPALVPVEPDENEPGIVLAGPQARQALARLYGAPAEQVEAACLRGLQHARDTSGSIGAPFEPWLVALGIEWWAGGKLIPQTVLR